MVQTLHMRGTSNRLEFTHIKPMVKMIMNETIRMKKGWKLTEI